VLLKQTADGAQQQQQQQQGSQLQLALPNYAPALKQVQPHAILITSASGLLGLAYLQQQLQAQGHDLPVHTCCTEPCLHFFQQQAQELLDADRESQTHQQQKQQLADVAADKADGQQQQRLGCPALHQMAVLHQQLHQVLLNKQPDPQQQQQQQQSCARSVIPAAAAAAQLTVPLFSPEELQSVLDAVQIVRFGQRVLLPGCFGITVEARPSGSGVGSCMWLMTCGDQR
jgi:hypothetical protein